jgi:DNA-binding transcriptional LysR family regulator
MTPAPTGRSHHRCRSSASATATAAGHPDPPLPRPIPLRVQPVGGESLDSWLHAYARRLDVTVTTMLNALGLREPWGPIPDFTVGLSDPEAHRAGHAAGLPTGLLHAMTLTGHAPQVLRLRADGRRLDPHTSSWLRPRGSRFCPDCLRENGGRWPLAWQLSWTFACTRHHALLHDVCPACGMPARNGHPAAGPPPPATCCAALLRTPRPRAHGVVPPACGAHLTGLPALALPAGDPRLATQQHLDTLLAARVGHVSLWSDLHTLAWWLAFTATSDDFADFDPDTADAWARVTVRAWARHQYQAAADARVVAAVLTWALSVITAAFPDHPAPGLDPGLDPPDAAAAVEFLALRRRRGHQATGPSGHHLQGYKPSGMIAEGWRALSVPVQQLLLRAADPDLPRIDRLRARTPTPTPQLPGRLHSHRAQGEDSARARRARWIPQTLWPDWLIRLLPTSGHRHDAHRAALSAALLVPGLPTGLHPAQATAVTHPHLTRVTISGMLAGHLADGRVGVLAALCDLATGLDRHGGGIDYHRRRQGVDPDRLLAPGRWQDLCEQSDTHPGIGRRLIDARRYLFTTLTGADLTDPTHQLAYTANADRSLHLGFVERLPTPLRAVLLQHAADHLTGLGIDEPLTWSPPTDWVTSVPLADLPGRDPDDIDLHALRRLADTDTPAGAIAEQLHTSIDHVRLALERLARPAQPTGSRWSTRRRADRLLTADFYRREYQAAGKNLRQLSRETGFSRKLLAEYATAAGIPLRKARAPTPIDPDWLAEHYLTRGRSFTDLGALLGVDDMIVIRAAQRYGIPSRPTGVTSRPDLLARLPATAPPDLRAAVDGHLHAWSRLERFATAMTYSSLHQASTAMGINQVTLVGQFRRLETDIGAALFHRATPGRAQQPTPRGQALLDALARPDIKALRHPRARPAARGSAGARSVCPQAAARRRQPEPRQPRPLPADAPRDLRRAVEGQRGGWTRLQRFATAMAHPTLAEAAPAVGVTPATLIGQLQRLETDIGGPLFHRATSARRTRPTRRGAALLRALGRPDIQALATEHAPHQHTRPRPDPGADDIPLDVRRAVQGQRDGWTRLERFATTMNHPDITEAAAAIGINRTTLLQQLLRLENDVGTPLFRRATPQGRPHEPTRRGAALLRALNQPQVQAHRAARARLPQAPRPRRQGGPDHLRTQSGDDDSDHATS